MKHLARYALLALLSLGACTRTIWRPSLVSHVPDGTEARFRVGTDYVMVGRAVGWTAATPRLVSPSGDTIVIPSGARLEVRVKDPDRHTKAGAILGYVVGVAVMYATCADKKYCGEQNPTALLGLLAGGIVGHFVADYWVPVAWTAP